MKKGNGNPGGISITNKKNVEIPGNVLIFVFVITCGISSGVIFKNIAILNTGKG